MDPWTEGEVDDVSFWVDGQGLANFDWVDVRIVHTRRTPSSAEIGIQYQKAVEHVPIHPVVRDEQLRTVGCDLGLQRQV